MLKEKEKRAQENERETDKMKTTWSVILKKEYKRKFVRKSERDQIAERKREEGRGREKLEGENYR